MTHSAGTGISIFNNSDQVQKPISLSELQKIVNQFDKMESVDDVLWMSKATCESLLEQIGAKPSEPLIPGEEYLTLYALEGVQIHLDESLPFRAVESGTYQMDPRVSLAAPARFALAKKIVRHRYTI
jgi:hypothetical protein